MTQTKFLDSDNSINGFFSDAVSNGHSINGHAKYIDHTRDISENQSKGYIRLYRSVLDHWLWSASRKKTKLEAWIHLLLLAQFQPSKNSFGFNFIELAKGQILTSQEKLSKQWLWSRSSVRSFLNMLERDKMIITETNKNFTILTLCNYESYQSVQPSKSQQANIKKPSEGQQADTYKNDKNVNNVKNDNTNPASPGINIPFEIFWNKYEKKKGNQIKIKNKWQALSAAERELAMQHIELYKQEQPDKKYRQNPETYLNNKTFNDEVILSPKSKHHGKINNEPALEFGELK